MPTTTKHRHIPNAYQRNYSSSDSKSTITSLKPDTKTTTKARMSENTIVSIQNLQFPEISPNTPGIFKVKCQGNLMQSPESKSTTPSKQRGYDFTSSSNSNFNQMLVTIPKTFRTKYSSTSSNRKPRKVQSSEIIKTVKQKFQPDKETSENLFDSQHAKSKKRMNLNGAEWQRPCKESIAAGAPPKFVGTCPPNYEQIAKWSKSRQKFFLTQDPRKVHCLVNPKVLHSKQYSERKEFNALTKMVKHAQNICTGTASESSEDFICEIIDLENPLQLDFQGLDYSNTYQKDEQDLLNQRNYRRICRYMERKKIKAQTQQNVEDELHQEMINIPKSFEIRDRHDPEKPVYVETQQPLGKLFRSENKPYNQKIISVEKERRRNRYKELYLRNKVRKEQEKRETEIHSKAALDNLPLTVAETNLKKFIISIDQSFERNAGREMFLEKTQAERRTFPHTMLETKQFKNILKQKNLMARNKSRIAKEFFLQHKNKTKEFPAADLEISSGISDRSIKCSKISEQSTDDEDNMQVGKQQSKFKLRGFQFKLNSNLRGKLTQREKLQGTRKEKSCITRDQWLNQLAPKKQQIKLDVEKGIQKWRTPDDPQLVLFPPPFGFRPAQAKHSTIRQYIAKQLGRHYDRIRRKNLKLVKPRLRYSVKKFNLISYRFGDTAKRFSRIEDPLADVQMLKLKSTNEFMAAKALKKKRHQEDMKQKRLKLLGIPCEPVKKSRLQTKCENSSSSDSDWVPEQEPLIEEEHHHSRFERIEKEIKPLHLRGNMPAPKYREPTLRQHPRYPRDYDNQKVPSEMFDQIVLTTNLPIMQKLDKDKVKFGNVELKRRPYTDKFEARHHHDHWIPTQLQHVNVHYQPQLVKAKVTEARKKCDRPIRSENFLQANPPCNQFVDMNLSLPQYDIEEMIRDHHSKSFNNKAKESGVRKTADLCTQNDYRLQSRDPKELENLDYPGRKEYLQLLKDVREFHQENKKVDEEYSASVYVDKTDLLKELEEDLKSIESCLTSLSSSICTNLTNDSGSFLLMEGKEKIPLDFIRKSIVPFEELQRSRFQAVPIDVNKEQENPFQVLPFAGQKKNQLELTTAKDSFFTFNTRLKNGMRLRLEVPVEDVREKLLGKGSNKHKGVVATDIDENYVEDLKHRPSIKLYKFKTSQSFVKDALRLKFESMLIQGQIVRTKIYDRLNEQHWGDMQKVKELFEKLFSKWEKMEYDSAMAVVYRVKRFYDETDNLKTEDKQLERELARLNMDIVFLEAHWVRCVMLQNFHYLLGDQEWRLQHDWIHRQDNAENELENFEESIAKRSTINIRKREKDDAWAIKTYYEEVYLRNKRENLVVFANAESFLNGLKNLKTKTFIILLEMHFTLAIQSELQHKLESFEEWCADDLREKEEYVSRKCAKLYFLADRVKWLNQRTLRFLEEPIEKCYNDELFHKDRAVIIQTFESVVPLNLRASSGHELYTVDMVSTLLEVVMDLLAKFEKIPMDLVHQIETKLRTYRAYQRKLSFQAYLTERRIDMEMKKVVKNLEPPYQKPKRTSKLPRYHFKKREKPIKLKEKIISERAKFFSRAFDEDEFTMPKVDVSDSIIEVSDTQEQIVPFYFDHFLKLNGYTPNYNFKTKIEIRDGPEIGRFQVKSVVPEVLERMEQSEILKRKIMEENIAQNPKMYVDVMT